MSIRDPHRRAPVRLIAATYAAVISVSFACGAAAGWLFL